jgi:GNAT superfamily N-acetyltransferase
MAFVSGSLVMTIANGRDCRSDTWRFLMRQHVCYHGGERSPDISMTHKLVTRTAVMAEHLDLEALQRRASLNNPGDREALLANPDAIELPRDQIAAGHVFVADADGRVVGMAAVVCRDDGDVDLDALFVEPELWRRGIGRVLIERCVQFARAHGSAALHVVGNPHAEAFYRSCGFEMVGTVSTRFGVGLACRKTLEPPGPDGHAPSS